MKVKILSSFNDKYLGTYYKKNEIVDLDDKRIKEILEVGEFIEVLKETKKAKKE